MSKCSKCGHDSERKPWRSEEVGDIIGDNNYFDMKESLLMSDSEIDHQFNSILNRLKIDSFYGGPAITLESQQRAQDELLELFKSELAQAETRGRLDELKSAYTAHPGIDTEYLDQRIAELTKELK